MLAGLGVRRAAPLRCHEPRPVVAVIDDHLHAHLAQGVDDAVLTSNRRPGLVARIRLPPKTSGSPVPPVGCTPRLASTSSSRSNRHGDGTGRNVQVSALAVSVGVRGAVPMSGWVVTQLVTQHASTCGGRRGAIASSAWESDR